MECGRLIITPLSGKPVPDEWLKLNRAALVCEIASAAAINIFQYRRYHAGKFGVRNFDGVLLHYTNIVTGDTAQVFFNCETARARTTKAGKKGEPLPKGQFRVSANHAFAKYWLGLGLALPRLSEFHYCMGKLGLVYVTGVQDEKGKIDKATLKPVTLNNDELKKAFLIGERLPDNSPIKTRQLPDNSPIRVPDKETMQNKAHQGFYGNSSTDEVSTILSNQVSASKALPLDSLSMEFEQQSVDEWLVDYDSF